MKNRNFLVMLFMAIFTMIGVTSCNDDEEDKKVTGYKEYTLTVASEKLPGVLTSSDNNVLTDVYAVKNEQSTDWEAQGSIGKFEYEEGYEYQIRISETNYLDYRMGDPAWTEYELLEVISKEHKNSENLPPHFIPDWYFEQYCPYINPEFAYAIDADKKEDIENDLKTNSTYKFGGLRYYIAFYGIGIWFLQDDDMHTVEHGVLIRKSKELTEFPESYKLLPLEIKNYEFGEFNFVTSDDTEDYVMQYDVFMYVVAPQIVDIWLYKDLTAYYQRKYPAADVKAVVIRYEVKNL
ncbi:DUF4377 domain-containing protein [Bacteroides acidifaciens]|uniref:DUF4377 domain-containing protein n=1 Tax=Bacteroides acidifaciens TaxID=85831 RepID=UPI00248B93D3|nr:DUF4377 domain-containing protein [Bacteroides acidifaciens]